MLTIDIENSFVRAELDVSGLNRGCRAYADWRSPPDRSCSPRLSTIVDIDKRRAQGGRPRSRGCFCNRSWPHLNGHTYRQEQSWRSSVYHTKLAKVNDVERLLPYRRRSSARDPDTIIAEKPRLSRRRPTALRSSQYSIALHKHGLVVAAIKPSKGLFK